MAWFTAFEAVDASALAIQPPPDADAEFDSDDENEAVMGSSDFSATSASTINLAVPGTMPAERRSIDRSIDSLRDEASDASASSKSSTLRRPPSQDGHRPGHGERRLSAVPAGAAPTMARKPSPRRLKVTPPPPRPFPTPPHRSRLPLTKGVLSLRSKKGRR